MRPSSGRDNEVDALRRVRADGCTRARPSTVSRARSHGGGAESRRRHGAHSDRPCGPGRTRSAGAQVRSGRLRRRDLRAGSATPGEYGVVSSDTRAIVEAMVAAGVPRLVVVSVAGVSTIPTPSRLDPPKRAREWVLHADSALAAGEPAVAEALRGCRPDGTRAADERLPLLNGTTSRRSGTTDRLRAERPRWLPDRAGGCGTFRAPCARFARNRAALRRRGVLKGVL